MNVTFRQLRVFEAVAQELSFTRAADTLHITQPAVSMQIKQLEGAVGLPLFEQVGKKTYLTEAGRELHTYNRRVIQLLEEADDVIQAMKGIQRGRLRVSVASTANQFASRLLASFVHRHPGVSFSLDVTNREALLNQLAHNDCDLAIMGKPPDDEDLQSEAFLQNPLVMIGPRNHPLSKEKNIPVERLADACFVVRESGSGTRSAAERFFAEREVNFSPGIEMTSNEAIKQAVEAGLGLAVVSIHTLELELETKRLAILDVEGFPIERHWYLVHRCGKRLTPVGTAFREYVLAEAKHYASVPNPG